jgi:hypothetical protein
MTYIAVLTIFGLVEWQINDDGAKVMIPEQIFELVAEKSEWRPEDEFETGAKVSS